MYLNGFVTLLEFNWVFSVTQFDSSPAILNDATKIFCGKCLMFFLKQDSSDGDQLLF